MKKLIPLLLLIITLISCNKEQSKPVIYITPTLTTENNKWVMNFQYSDTIDTKGMVRFYWIVSDSNKKQYKWFGALPLEEPKKSQTYNSEITSFTPYLVDSLIVITDDYFNKYIIFVNK